MEYIYKRYSSTFWFAFEIIIAFGAIVAIMAIIVLIALRKKKTEYIWFTRLFVLVIPIFLLFYVIFCTLEESKGYNKFVNKEYASVKGSFCLESVEYNRIGEPYCSFYINDYLFYDISGVEGEIVSKIEDGDIIEIHFILDEDNVFDGSSFVIFEIIKITKTE